MLFQKFRTEQLMSCKQILRGKKSTVKKLFCIQVLLKKRILKYSMPLNLTKTF